MPNSDKLTNYYLWLDERGINMPVFTVAPESISEKNERLVATENQCVDCQRVNNLRPKQKKTFGSSSPKILFIGDGHSPASNDDDGPLPSGEKNLIVNIAKALGLTLDSFQYSNHNTCERHFIADLNQMKPSGIVLLGSETLNLVSGKILNFSALRGKIMTPDLYKIPTVVTHHLREMIKNPDCKATVWNDLKLLKDHLDQHQDRT